MLTQRGRETIGDESLENWQSLGSGGFGEVLRAKHKDWHFEVAIKLLHVGSDTSCPALGREADLMDSATIQYFPRVYGMYQGYPPGMDFKRQGIVMELMERGSLQSLQQALSKPPPWPLVFRLADQVALAMNFLHSKKMPLVHMDLKPGNVLLDANLNAKISDFGLSSVSTSVLKTSDKGDHGGTAAYTPPEAFERAYNRVRSYDIYSYGILLWTIITGKEPYPVSDYSLLAFRIKQGDRPDLDRIDPKDADGLEELVGLMKRCWDAESTKRPLFRECIEVTSHVVSRNAKGINKAVYEVLTELDQVDGQECVLPNSCSLPPAIPSLPVFSSRSQAVSRDVKVDHGDFGKSKGPSKQDADESLTSEKTDAEKAQFVVQNRAQLTQNVSTVMAIADSLGPMVHPELYARIQAEKTSMEQMRTLYTTRLQTGGIKIRAAFYDALKQHEPHLLD